MKLTFNINLLSDYHIGAGYGKGVIDSVILKDKNGLPTIRGTTLTGLLRQGMWELLQLDILSQHRKCKQSGASENSYCMETDEKLICPICRILGSPKYPKKWKTSSAQIEGPSILRSEKIVWRNRVNPRIHTAESRKLFNEETARGNINFVFTVSNESDDKKSLEEASFIVAAFRMIRNIGASRRRGKGLCQFHLVDITPGLSELEDIKITSKEENLLDIFKTKWLENKELNIIEKNNLIGQAVKISPTKMRFNLILLTKEPLLISNRSESGNRFQTNDYIPGYTMLGAFAWKVANRCGLTNKDIYDKFINLFRKGGIKVSPLYPCCKIDDDIYPTIPSPQDFLICKLHPKFEEDNEHDIKAFATDKNEPKNCDKCSKMGLETSLVPLNKFVPLYSRRERVDVAKREEMHITIDPETGRTRTGDLFSYAAIESEQYFIGTIDIENWVDFVVLSGIDDSQENILFELRVGKASSRGYGLTQIWFNEKDTEITFLGKPIEERVKNITEPLTMTLITDAILMDKWERFYSTLNSEMLDQILGVDVEVINTYVKTQNIDGFNTYLGLPKWREHAISAGSSIGFKIKNSVRNNELLERLGKLEEEGIGLRKNEGFGKVVFNHTIYEKNVDVDVRINLPEFMRVYKPGENIKNFEHRWQNYLAKSLHKNNFSQDEWKAVARWLRENSKMPIEEIAETFSNFHSPEKITELVNIKKPYRDKKKFLEGKGEKGRDLLLKSFKKLSERLENENVAIREHLQFRGIEMLADFIESLRGE